MSWDFNNAQTLWNALKPYCNNNEYGVAGLMGNLDAESGLYPNRLQGDIPFSQASIDYTAQVDSGAISEYNFVHNGPNGGGYGLAQWTYYTRKQSLYDMKQAMNVSIGSMDLGIAYLEWELTNNYSGVLSAIQNATTIRSASDAVLTGFENPADQSESVKVARAQLGQAIYDTFAGSTPPTPSGATWHKMPMIYYTVVE